MSYSQITQEERYRIHGLRNQGWCPAAIAREVGRHRSTIGREFERNGRRPLAYEPYRADCRAKVRRAWSRRNRRVTPRHCARVVRFLKADWSPEQIAGRLRRRGRLRICHATIYHYIWQDRAAGGELYRLLRTGGRRRARYGSRIHRGRRILGRSIATRPARIEQRQQLGHWEVDPIAGGQELASALTLVERKTGYVLIGALRSKTAADFARRTIALVRAQGPHVRTITADNGSELTGYRLIDRATNARFYFAHPYHAWERGTNENPNGLIRPYLPKRKSMAALTQRACAAIARKLNTRPRKRLGYLTPEECYAP
jgi:IS30 family transposase